MLLVHGSKLFNLEVKRYAVCSSVRNICINTECLHKAKEKICMQGAISINSVGFCLEGRTRVAKVCFVDFCIFLRELLSLFSKPKHKFTQ